MINKTKIISYDHRARFFWILATISMLSLALYIYAINAVARNVALRQDLEKQIVKISANLDSLEFVYIGLKNNVTIELAQERGFKEVKNPLYVSRARAASLSFNALER